MDDPVPFDAAFNFAESAESRKVSGAAAVLDGLTPLTDGLIGYRNQLQSLGFARENAETMCIEVHARLVGLVFDTARREQGFTTGGFCTRACSEGHTYEPGCDLHADLVRAAAEPPGDGLDADVGTTSPEDPANPERLAVEWGERTQVAVGCLAVVAVVLLVALAVILVVHLIG